MRRLFICLILLATFSLKAENDYFKKWEKEIFPTVFMKKEKGLKAILFSGSDTLNLRTYFIYKSTLYVEGDSWTKRLHNGAFESVGSKSLEEVNMEMWWKRSFKFYHGFPSVLTLILCIPSLFLILLPLAMKLANLIVGKERKVFAVKLRWFWIVLIILGWTAEWWLRHNPQSF